MTQTKGNAFLSFNDSGHPLNSKSFTVKVIQLTESLNVELAVNTNRSGAHYFPIRTKQADLQFSIQCRDTKEYDRIRTAIAESQSRIVTEGTGSGVVRLRYPDRKIDYSGYITNVSGGSRRFEFAPVIPLFMVLIKDRVGIITTTSSATTGVWKDVAGNSLVDIYGRSPVANPEYAADQVLKDNTPPPASVVGRPSQSPNTKPGGRPMSPR